ncbi:hypothetical protein CVT25_012408 [Psilocybe cyanescens]|uniref:Cytochrome P450 n=1 Tax=Psilocybe cyanescens TaxID=93625 RepID=A0A409X7J4_PSICY|nr:hypothetical protein CVT25_012408 [Psilocybe cyanescens]
MELPPGLVYIFGHLPRVLISSTSTYIGLYILQDRQVLPNLPSWAPIVVAILAWPIIFIAHRYNTLWANKRAAAANGATIAPFVNKSPLAIISEVVETIRNGYPGEVVLRWTKEYGNVVQFDLFTSTATFEIRTDASVKMIVDEPEHVKAVLATQFDSFAKGEMWKFHRAMTRPFFTRERISDFEIYDRNWDLSLKLAKERIEEGHSIDIQDLVSRFTLDSATEFLFGASVGSLSAGIPYPPAHIESNTPSFYNHPSTKFVKAFTEGLILAAVRTGLGREWPLVEFGHDKITPLRKVMDEFTDPLMKMALAKREQDLADGIESKDKEEMTLLAHLVNHTQGQIIYTTTGFIELINPVDPKMLKDELINLLVAGRDTTMCLLTFAIYMLAEHPDIEKRLRQEIFDKVGPTDGPKYEQMRDMKYTRAFLNEVLRLYPPVPADSRTTTRPVVLPPARKGQKPIFIPKDTTCLYTVINIHRRTDLWGPDVDSTNAALTFDPDRFLDDRVQKYLVPNPFIFCPFNAGPRICLGQQFAYHEATYYLVRLLQHFTEFTLDQLSNLPPPEQWKSGDALVAAEKIRPTSHLTMYIKGGLWVRMKELKTNEA